MKKRMRIQQLPEAEEISACFPRFFLGLQPRSTTTQEEVFKNGKSGSILKTIQDPGMILRIRDFLKSSSGEGCGFLVRKGKKQQKLAELSEFFAVFSSWVNPKLRKLERSMSVPLGVIILPTQTLHY